ncbi:MAG: proline--tRNA ligase [Candidatus Pacebacteria bacterium]|nr:proline--tRNA ligase [Candidatus Paceibacterota bacterium]
MRLSRLIGQRIKETPRDAQTASHIFLLRGGYARPVSTGIYSLLPLGTRITAKIEAIIREEMNRIDGQEVLMPVVLPEELWEESGRARSVGSELLRFEDRNGKPMLLGMTHEEAVVHLARTEVNSYKQLPFVLYQIQTKYRDEARPRAGLIRVREFTMKDAYSFHATQDDLDQYYERAHDAYVRIFNRMGMHDVASIQSDTGMMGGAVSHEFMAIAESGEDTIFMSPKGQYKANRDIAIANVHFKKEDPLPLSKVHTPGQQTIEEVAAYLGKQPADTGKAVFYLDGDDNLIFAMIRGDFEVNETKLKNYLQTSAIRFADDAAIRRAGAEPGYASPMDLDAESVRIIVDRSVAESSNLVVGANEADYHYENFNFERDLDAGEVTDIAVVRPGDPCPVTGQPLQMKRGIEVGNIFQLGTKYTEPMKCTFLDPNGVAQPMIMGCYGIGVGRSMAAVIEQSHDEYGPIWPIAIAPYHVHICVLNPNKPGVSEMAEHLYRELHNRGVEVLLDDRGEKAGFAFNDADLIGIPLRLIVSPKNVAQGKVEFKTRDGGQREMFDADNVVDIMAAMVDDLLAYSAGE